LSLLSNTTTNESGCHAEKDAAYLVDQSGAEGFRGVPVEAQLTCVTALTLAAEGSKADIAKPLLGLGAPVMEIALKHRGDAFRVVCAVQLGEDIWVLHAFQKKSTQGIKTPKHEIDLIR